MSLMEAKSDLLRECKIKFVHTFQVRFRIQQLYITGIKCIFVFSDFVRILVASAICEFSINPAIFSSDMR